jgi:uncharacterized membrane protein
MPSEPQMGTGRLEAFSDGVIAIIITIMVLELHVPRGDDPWLLLQVWPIFVSYAVSFLTVAIYWVNHHGLIHQARRASTAVLWSNILWLFFLSLIPFATANMGQNHVSHFSAALYAFVMLATALGYLALRLALAHELRGDSDYQAAHRPAQRKLWIAVTSYMLAVVVAFIAPYLSLLLVFLVAASYFLPGAWLGKLRSR